jgi:hypothetical protein
LDSFKHKGKKGTSARLNKVNSANSISLISKGSTRKFHTNSTANLETLNTNLNILNKKPKTNTDEEVIGVNDFIVQIKPSCLLRS